MGNELSWNGLTKEQYLAYLLKEGYQEHELEDEMNAEFEGGFENDIDITDCDTINDNDSSDIFSMTDKEFYDYTGDSKFYGQKIF